jgi:replicative superfamily II helicase
MINFKKRLGIASVQKKVHPVELYDTLDRASDKGELRRAQEAVLVEWHGKRRQDKDVIVKLHTGQGKTLIGLLVLQSKLNELPGTGVYLCPNNFLIDQTCTQAKQFGIEVCRADGDLPEEFSSGTILVTSVQKMFNGRTKFRLGNRSLDVSYLVMDDCHACIDSIREAFTVRVLQEDKLYSDLLALFRDALRSQGAGTLAELEKGNGDSLLPVPYWEWSEKIDESVELISAAVAGEDEKKGKSDFWFAWPLLKDALEHCQCIISGKALEITPYLPALHKFGSFAHAKHRVFMSATVTNDAFLVKGLRLSPATIRNPIIYKKEKWSGEKMIVIPSLISPTLDREIMVPELARPDPGRKHGCLALIPSFWGRAEWEKLGSLVATTELISKYIERLRQGDFEKTVVLVNRYDGVDLPDQMCRVLIFDQKPRGETLLAAYEQDCRAMSEIVAMRDARTIEQGLGRSVRGEKDYCAIVMLGADLVKFIRSPDTRKHLSSQTRIQIELGLEIAKFAQEDVKGKTPMEIFWGVVRQCLERDPDWKEYYSQRMDAISSDQVKDDILDIFQTELDAAEAYESADYERASLILQKLIDGKIKVPSEKYWYLQERARYIYAASRDECFKLQLAAYNGNRYLLKPPRGVAVQRLVAMSYERVENIIDSVRRYENYEQLTLAVDEVLGRLQFGVKADRFEEALKELGRMLGFASERPDKEWKEGPDNLWELSVGNYLLFEDKSEVDQARSDINKNETGQMSNAMAWFEKNYSGSNSTNILIIPAKYLPGSGGFLKPVLIMMARELRKLRYAVRQFFNEFSGADFSSLSDSKIQGWLVSHDLQVKDLQEKYGVQPKERKSGAK